MAAFAPLVVGEPTDSLTGAGFFSSGGLVFWTRRTTMHFDLPLDQLKTYNPPLDEPGDFNTFWTTTIAEARRQPSRGGVHPVRKPPQARRGVRRDLPRVRGSAGQGLVPRPGGAQGQADLRGRVHRVRGRAGASPGVAGVSVGGVRAVRHGQPGPGIGVADRRHSRPRGRGGQPSGSRIHDPGILKKETYYYRRVFTDAVRAIEAARSHEAVDGDRIAAPAGARAAGSRSRRRDWSPISSWLCPTCPFCATSRGPSPWSTPLPIPKSGIS